MKTIQRMRNDWQLYLFLLVPLVYIIIFAYFPMMGAQIAFRKFTAREGIWGSAWVGFDNFIKFFKSYQFKQVISNTIILSVSTIIAGFPVPIIFALLMNSLTSQKFKKISQTIVNLPHFISIVVLVGILFQIFNNNTGLYGTVLQSISGVKAPDLFSNPRNFRIMYVASGIWQEFGWGSIIYLAALAGVSTDLHEAAVIDGASRFQRVIHIDFPGILPTITILLILRMGTVMSIGFEKVFLMQNSVNLPLSEVISTYVYKTGLMGTTDFSYSTAIGLFNSVINMILIVTVNFFTRRMSETSLW